MIDWVVGDAYQDIAQVGFWINAVELCVFDERIHSGCLLAAIGAGADNCSCRWRRRAGPRPLGRIVVETQTAIVKAADQR